MPRLRIIKPGFAPLDTVLPAGTSGTVVLVLRRNETALPTVVVQDRASPSSATTIRTENARQVPALGEPDVLRALPLLSGVSQSNDLVNRFHVWGGAGDENLVRLDGYPLQHPHHLGGLLGVFNIAALEEATLHTLAMPQGRSGPISSVLDLRTRSTTRRGREVTASLLAASATLVETDLIAGVDVLASSRFSYADLLARAIQGTVVDTDDWRVPGFGDVMLKATRRWGSSWNGEFLAYSAFDQVPRVNGSVRPARGDERLVGVSLQRATNRPTLRLRVAESRATVSQQGRLIADDPFIGSYSPMIDLRQQWRVAEVHMSSRLAGARLDVGASLDDRRHRHAWVDAGSLLDIPRPFALRRSAHQRQALAFAEVLVPIASALSLTTGADLLAVGSGQWGAPRVGASWTAGRALELSMAWNRRLQFDHQIGDPGTPVMLQPTFLRETPRVASVSSATLRVRPMREPAASRSLELTLFHKILKDRPMVAFSLPPVRDTTPIGDLPVILVDSRTAGANVTAELQSAAGAILRGSYTWQRTVDRDSAATYAPDWDLPHNLTVFASSPKLRGWRLNSSAIVRSGLPFTPGVWGSRPDVSLRNSARGQIYSRVDVGARREWSARGVSWALSLQVLNVLARQNINRNSSESLPLLPSLGFEARW